MPAKLHSCCAIALLASACATQAATFNWPQAHLQTAANWLGRILPENNVYGSPAAISLDANQVLRATSQCGSFMALLLQQSYPQLSADVLQGLTGSVSPDAAQWYDALDPAIAHSAYRGMALQPLDAAAGLAANGRRLRLHGSLLLQRGDLLVSKYKAGDSRGHVMMVESFIAPAPAQVMSLQDTRAIPGVSLVRRWMVTVIDSTSSAHGSSDSRYLNDSRESDGHDRGIGRAVLYLYEDASPGSGQQGHLAGWSWSTASAYTYQFSQPGAVDNLGKSTYRPLLIGRMVQLQAK
ncbi:hypothetical protein V8J88_00055 [Massilia sp. W12]|uniref:hypothetical protein n=1 Tax=Massilia sp. W12 TaxID=3126507 RepID=UPI0030D217F6